MLPLLDITGFKPDLHDVQLLGFMEHVAHAGTHEKHYLLPFNCVPYLHDVHPSLPSVPN